MGEENKKKMGFFIIWLGGILVESNHFLSRSTRNKGPSDLEKNRQKKDS